MVRSLSLPLLFLTTLLLLSPLLQPVLAQGGPCDEAADCNEANGGTCTGNTGTTCECGQGYTGSHCANPPPCEAACADHGGCNGAGTECVDCTGGYTSEATLCDTPPACEAACEDHGGCNGAGTECVDCTGGYTSEATLCATPPACEAACAAAEHNDGCDTSDYVGCDCNGGYSGDLCTVPPPCVAACDDHGGCNEDGDGCEGPCADDYTGDLCEIAPGTTPVCPTGTGATTCNGHGVCSDDETECECSDNYTGDFCATAPNCDSNTDCGGHGTCDANGAKCTCTGGYSGTLCATAPACVSGAVSCSGHGSCNAGGTACDCDEGWDDSDEDDCSVQDANAALVTLYTGVNCTSGLVGTREVELASSPTDTAKCAILSDGTPYISALAACGDGVGGEVSGVVFTSSIACATTATTAEKTQFEEDHGECVRVGTTNNWVTVECIRATGAASAIRVQTSIIALLAIIVAALIRQQ